MNTSEPPARLAVSNLDDLVGVVPYLIGFHPEESLVVLVVADGRIEVTARVDLASLDAPEALEQLVGRLFERFPRADGWFLAYTDDPERAWPVLNGCADLAGAMRLGRLVQVGERQWWADHRDGPSGVVATSESAAEATVLGLPARSSRAELADQVAGPPDAETDALMRAFEQAAAEIDQLSAAGRRRLLRRLCQTADQPYDYVRLSVLAVEPDAQLAVLRRLDHATAAEMTRVWTAVVRHSLMPYLVGPLGLVGVSAWLTGDGAMATICLERLDRVDPLAPLAAVLDWINATVLPPASWPRCRTVLLEALADQFTLLGQPITSSGP